MPKYCVEIQAKGWLYVEAPSKIDAMNLAERKGRTDKVIWDDDWIAVNAEEDGGFWGEYIEEDYDLL